MSEARPRITLPHVFPVSRWRAGLFSGERIMRVNIGITALKISMLMAFPLPPLLLAQEANAEVFLWGVTFIYSLHEKPYSSPSEGCSAALAYYQHQGQSTGYTYSLNYLRRVSDEDFTCSLKRFDKGEPFGEVGGSIFRAGDLCPLGAKYNAETGSCDCRPGYEMDDAGCKLPDKNGPDKGAPPPEGCAGNPVNITNGNKYQVEHDLITPIPLARHYNGLDGLWRHSFSARITRKDDSYLLYREDGKVSEFTGAGRDLTSLTDLGKLSRLAGRFFYTSELNETIEFDPYGKLARLTTKEGRKYRVERGANLTISDEHGNKLVLSEGANHQLLRAQTGGISIEYTYDKEQRLTSVTRTDGQYSTKTQYLYDDPRNIKLLTGILDNNNRRFATWTYDDQGRAISSEHANGAEKVTLAYNDDGSTTVTNEYGKQATYRFQVIQGIKRIVAIEGEPSPNCPSSNSTFTYDDQGLLTSKRDNNGNLTTYQYNARGLETTRTEAAGTAQARTITTDWHPTLFLPVQVSEPGRITRYQYDAEGRKTGETVTTR
ncbi:DUF6531 domain-containing protein [Pseudomonas aeruginosa]|uniref:DUF6531 domain-containing protein n=1 Tax=Pseudomonas aeruginosa TaxID=287 RepID=UPI0039B74E43